MMKFAIIDLDGTLCDDTHRVPHASAGNWEDYFCKLTDDPVHIDVRYLIHMICDTAKILLLTSRQERYREMTLEHLHKHEIPFHYLLMRKDDDERDSAVNKISQLEEFFGSKEKVLESVLFALEDRDKIVNAFRDYGIVCYQVRAEKIFGTEHVSGDARSLIGDNFENEHWYSEQTRRWDALEKAGWKFGRPKPMLSKIGLTMHNGNETHTVYVPRDQDFQEIHTQLLKCVEYHANYRSNK